MKYVLAIACCQLAMSTLELLMALLGVSGVLPLQETCSVSKITIAGFFLAFEGVVYNSLLMVATSSILGEFLPSVRACLCPRTGTQLKATNEAREARDHRWFITAFRDHGSDSGAGRVCCMQRTSARWKLSSVQRCLPVLRCWGQPTILASHYLVRAHATVCHSHLNLRCDDCYQ